MTQIYFRHALLPAGWAADVRIGIADGVISAVETGATPAPDNDVHGLGLPGLINLHSHSFQRAIAGRAEYRDESGDNFWSWREQMYHFGLGMTPEDVEAVAALAFAEMLEGGFTGVAEFHYLHHAPDGRPYDDIGELAARIAAAAAIAGIGLLLLPVFYAHANFGGGPPAPEQRRFINGLDGYARLLERCRALAPSGVAPHSLRAVTPAELTAVVAMAGDAPIHIHVAEQQREVEDCLAWSGTRPVAWLLDHAPVDRRWCLVHATQAEAAERAGMARSGAVLGLCPITEANLGDGIFDGATYAGPLGIGTDSNVLIDVAQELRQLEYSQRLLRRQRNVMAGAKARGTATALYARAHAGGARAAARPSLGLERNAPADIVAWRDDGGAPDVSLAGAVFAARRPAVETVWVAGRKLVEQGRHRDGEAIRRRYDQAVARLV